MSALHPGLARIVIIGGGYSGASAAVQLTRRSTRPLSIHVVEPRAQLGRGLAYSAQDPDHRLNATIDRHMLDPLDAQDFERWCQANHILHDDPQARWEDGRLYARRWDFGSFMADTVAACAQGKNGGHITHVRDEACAVRTLPDGRHTVQLRHAGLLTADLVVLATGNPVPRLPGFVAPGLAGQRAVIDNPMDVARIRAEIAPTDRVFVLGNGLTALDVMSTLLREGHRGSITVVSRTGLRPRPQVPLIPSQAQVQVQAQVQAQVQVQAMASPSVRVFDPAPDFVARLGPSPTVRQLTRALRERTTQDARAGVPWQVPFDLLRDGVWDFWPRVAAHEKARYARHLRIWYDVHRFRTPPQNDAMVAQAQRDGLIHFHAARVTRIEPGPGGSRVCVVLVPRGAEQPETVDADALINCTGVDGGGPRSNNPVLADLLAQGHLQPGPAGMGYLVDEALRVVGADGRARDRLRLIGPPTVGVCGDTIGAAFIAVAIGRALPAWLQALQDLHA